MPVFRPQFTIALLTLTATALFTPNTEAADYVRVVGGAAQSGPAIAAGAALSAAERSQIEGYGKTFVEAVNTDTATVRTAAVPAVFARSFIDKVGEARLVSLFERLHATYVALEFHHAEVVEYQKSGSVSRIMHIYARAKGAAGWKDIQCRIEPAAPFRISELAFIADVAEPVYLPNGSIADPATHRWLTGYIDKLVAENGLSGCILVAVGDTPIFERYFGFADAAGKVRVSEATRFNLGSGNKMFTALAVAQLVEQGKLKYSDPILEFFPDFPDKAFAAKATVHHLLSHTSGVREYWTDEYDKESAAIRGTADMLPWVYKVGTEFEPGSEYRYSNSNFVLAGLIVERVSGEDYYAYVRKHITGPLEMTSTDWYVRDGKSPDLATPLVRQDTAWATAPAGQSRGSAAGGGYSTTRDILKFGRGLVAGKIVRPETLRDMTSSKSTKTADAESYGYGFILQRAGGSSSYGHGGIARGVNFEFRYFPADDVTLVVFSNQDNGAYDDLRRNVTKLITGAR